MFLSWKTTKAASLSMIPLLKPCLYTSLVHGQWYLENILSLEIISMLSKLLEELDVFLDDRITQSTQ